MTNPRIHVTGVLSMDQVRQGAVELHCLGSSGLYVSVALARLGHAVSFWSRIGEDFDRSLLRELRRESIAWKLRPVSGPSARLRLVYDDTGHIAEFECDPGVGGCLDVNDLGDGFWAAPCVWLGTAASDYHWDVARRAASQNRRVFLSPQGDYGGDWRAFSRLLPHLAGVFLNTREAQQVTGEPLHLAVLRLSEGRPEMVCSITRGELGAFLAWRDTLFRLTVRPQPAANATGAGDTYAAALVHSMLAGRTAEDCLRFAAVAAALSLRDFVYRAVPTETQVVQEMQQQVAQIAVDSTPMHSHAAVRWLEGSESADSLDRLVHGTRKG